MAKESSIFVWSTDQICWLGPQRLPIAMRHFFSLITSIGLNFKQLYHFPFKPTLYWEWKCAGDADTWKQSKSGLCMQTGIYSYILHENTFLLVQVSQGRLFCGSISSFFLRSLISLQRGQEAVDFQWHGSASISFRDHTVINRLNPFPLFCSLCVARFLTLSFMKPSQPPRTMYFTWLLLDEYVLYHNNISVSAGSPYSLKCYFFLVYMRKGSCLTLLFALPPLVSTHIHEGLKFPISSWWDCAIFSGLQWRMLVILEHGPFPFYDPILCFPTTPSCSVVLTLLKI